MKRAITTRFQTSLQFVRFAIVGASGTIITLAILYTFTEFLNFVYWLSLPIGYIVGLTNNFIWNRKYTFEKTDQSILKEYAKYTLSMLVGAIAYNLSTIILTEFFSIWYFYSAVLSVGISTFIDFVLSKFWVFGQFRIYIVDTEEFFGPKLSIKLIASCLNEQDNVKEFITDLLEHVPEQVDLSLVLVDNGSTDRTWEVIESLARMYPNIIPVHREQPFPYGKSIRLALTTPVPIKPDYIGWVWSDNQISGQSVVKVLNALNVSKPRLVKALRYDKDYTLWRKIQSFCFNMIISLLFNKRLQDVNGCPKFFKSDLFPYLDLQSDGWFLDAEVLLKISALVEDDEIVYVPVRYSKRVRGKSKTSWFTAFELLLTAVKFRFWGTRAWIKKKRLKEHEQGVLSEKQGVEQVKAGESQVDSALGPK